MKNCFITCLLLVSLTLFSQDYDFRLNGNAITPKEDYKLQLRNTSLIDSVESSDYCILQFYQVPTKADKERLKAKGVTFINFLQGTAFYAHLAKGVNLGNAGEELVRSIISIKPQYKIDANISTGNIPEYALVGKDLIKVNISCFYIPDSIVLVEDLYQIEVATYRKYKFGKLIYAEIPIIRVRELSKLHWVKNIELEAPPAVIGNAEAANVERANILSSTKRGLGYGLTGKGVRIGVWDTDVENHIDFTDRVTQHEYEYHSHEHGTHVTGTISGAGLIDPKGKGIAPDALIHAYHFNKHSNKLSVAEERYISLKQDSIVITSNSWGTDVNICPAAYKYNSSDMYDDIIAKHFPYFMFVFSAGNLQWLCSDGYSTTTKNRKNSLIVAAASRYDTITSFSSYGPTIDGRLLPNISADGLSLYSTVFDNKYGFMSGTSMATPAVTGVMALLYQRYKDTHGGELPLSSMMRALVCNTATDLGNPGPDYRYGYGMINGNRAIEVLENGYYYSDLIGQSVTKKNTITVPEGASALKVMLAWTDSAAYYGVDKALVNDLNLLVRKGGSGFTPWVLDPENPEQNAIRGRDKLNNMEQVTIAYPDPGQYTIAVNGYSVPGVTQQFSVVYDIVMPYLQMTYPVDGEVFEPGQEVIVRWDCQGYDKSFDLEYSVDNGETYEVIASDIDSARRYYAYNLPEDSRVKQGRFRISTGTVFDETSDAFSVMPVPQNLQAHLIDSTLFSSYKLSWNGAKNASYEVLKLNDQSYEHYAFTNDTTFTLTGLDADNDNNYFTVRALDKDTKATSERAYAVQAKALPAGIQLPFYENFETQRSSSFALITANTESLITYSFLGKGYGLILSGGNDTKDWEPSNVDSVFVKNPGFVSRAFMAPIDIPSKGDEPVLLSFDLLQLLQEKETAFLRIKINGKYLTDDAGKLLVLGGKKSSPVHLNFEISDYIETEVLNVEFEAVCKASYTRGGSTETGDFFFIDNISVVKPKDCMLVEKVELVNDSVVAVTLNNVAGIDLKDVQGWTTLNSKNGEKQNITSTLKKATSFNFLLKLPASINENAIYDLSCFVMADVNGYTDTVSYQTPVIIDRTLKMGEVSDTIVGDSLLFTDSGGLLNDFSTSEDGYLTFYPESNSDAIGIRFEDVMLNNKSGYIYVYSGDYANRKYLKTVTSMDSDLEHISDACSGALTILFKSYKGEPGAGWFAKVYTIKKQPDIIQLDSVKVKNDSIVTYITNCGCNTLNSYKIGHKLNNGVAEQDSISRDVAPLQMVIDTLSKKVNQSPDKVDTLYTWAYIPDKTDSKTPNVQTLIKNGNSDNIDAYTKEDCLVNTMVVLPRRDKKAEVICAYYNLSDIPVSNLIVGYSVNLSDTITDTIADVIAPHSTYNFSFEKLIDIADINIEYVVSAFAKTKDTTRTQSDTLRLYQTESTNRVIEFGADCERGIRIFNNEHIDLGNDFTFECWAKLEKVKSFGYFFYSNDAYLGYNNSSYMNSVDNSVVLGIKVNGDWSRMYVPDVLEMSKWQHIALTASGKDYKLYIDGISYDFTLVGNSLSSITWESGTWLGIGGSQFGYSSLHGYLDEIRFWDYCRTTDEISNNMLVDFTDNPDNLMAYYPIKAADGRYVYDFSNNDNTAELYDKFGYSDPKTRPEIQLGFEKLWIDNEQFKAEYNVSESHYTLYSKKANLDNMVLNFVPDMQSEVTVNGAKQVSGVTTNNFSVGSISYIVNGVGINNGVVDTYKIEIKHLSDSCELNSVVFLPEDNSVLSDTIVLNKKGNGFYANVDASIDLSQLRARFKLSEGATFSINGKDYDTSRTDTIDFTKPVIVKVVTQEKKSAKKYSLFLDQRNNKAELLNITVANSQIASPVFTDNQITLWMKKLTNKKCLAPKFWVSDNATVYVDGIRQRSGITANNFTTDVQYTVVSEDEKVENSWFVTASVDDILPEITLIGSDTIWVAKGEAYTDPGAEASDNLDGDISNEITASGVRFVNVNKVGTYQVAYAVTDRAGNTVTKNRLVIVQDASFVDQRSIASEIKIYCVEKLLFVESPMEKATGKLCIINTQGRILQTVTNLHQGLNQIPLALSPGIYLVSFRTDTEQITSKIRIQ